MELLFLHMKAEAGFGQLHRTDGADDVGEHLVGALREAAAVPALVGYVVGVVGQKNQVVGLHGYRGDDLPVELLRRILILQPGGPQGLQQLVLLTLHHLLGGEGDVHQVFAQGARQRLFQDGQHLFLLVVQHQGDGSGELAQNFPLVADIAAAELGNIGEIRPEPPAKLGYFSFVHGYLQIESIKVRSLSYHKSPFSSNPDL